jgi:hypothetical protein
LFVLHLVEVDQICGGSPCRSPCRTVPSIVAHVAALITDDMCEVCLACFWGNISLLGGLGGLTSGKSASSSCAVPCGCASPI